MGLKQPKVWTKVRLTERYQSTLDLRVRGDLTLEHSMMNATDPAGGIVIRQQLKQ